MVGGLGCVVDFFLKFVYDVNDWFSVIGGYCILEGGVDMDDVFSFVWLYYVVVLGVVWF